MKSRVMLYAFCLLPCLFLFQTQPAFATVVAVSSSGDGKFVVQGIGFSDVGGIDLTISYDKTTLANPRVAQGGLLNGASFVANPNDRENIHITALRIQPPINGSGPIAAINFSRTGSSPGRITAMNASIVNSAGKSISSQIQISNPSETSTSDTDSSTESGSRYLGQSTIALPGEQGEDRAQNTAPENNGPSPAQETKQGETGEPAPENVPEERKEPQETPPPPSVPPEKKSVTYTSVLERFRKFKGEKTPASLVALFDAGAMPGIRQEPPVVMSDGVARARVFIQIPSGATGTPRFSLKGARLMSLKTEGGAWVLDVLPDRNGYRATITMLNDGETTEIPLAVAPPMDAVIDPAVVPREKEFNLFLKERGTARTPLFDLNKDGKRDYIDDYIFTANYIARRNSTAGKGKGVKK